MIKALYVLLILCLPTYLHATANINIPYTDFAPYIGFNAGLNILNYTSHTKQDQDYLSATINAGVRISKNIGTEVFFTHSSSNDVNYIYNYETLIHELYYLAYGIDIFAYYNITKGLDFFTSFGIANYKIYNKYEYQNPFMTQDTTDTDTSITTRIGIGILYSIPHDSISLLLKYKYVPLNTEIINTMSEFSIGIRYNF